MTIAVAYKWAANPQDAAVGPDGAVDWSRAKEAISEYDPVAVELARGLADAAGLPLVGLSVGGPDVAGTMARKAALSRGLDELVVVADPALDGAGTTATALTLAALVREVGPTVVLTGDSSVDVGAQMVPTVLGGALGWPVLTQVTAVSGEPGDLLVRRAHLGGFQEVHVTGPVVLAVAADAVVPRVPGMKDILAAGKKPVREVPLAELAVPAVAVERVATAPAEVAARRRRVIDAADPAAAAAELVAALRADAVL